MNIKDIFLTASANLLRSKLRTSLTIVAIFIGAFTLTVTTGIGSGISQYIDKQLGNLGAKNVLIVQPNEIASGSGASGTGPKKYDPTKKVSAAGGFGGGASTVLTASDI